MEDWILYLTCHSTLIYFRLELICVSFYAQYAKDGFCYYFEVAFEKVYLIASNIVHDNKCSLFPASRQSPHFHLLKFFTGV